MSRQLKEVPARSYLSTAAFHLNFFTYTTSMNPSTFKKSGDLSAVSGATSSNCPAGRVLRENGRKLYPGAHDISTVNGVARTFPPGTVMVGVFDNQSGLNGFIDPNAPMFAVYNGDRAGYLKDAVDPVGGVTDQGAPVKTNGGVAVGPSGTLLTKILKGTNLAPSNSLPAPTHAGNYLIGDVYDLEFTLAGLTVNDSIIVNQRANFPGWLVTSPWPKIDGSGNVTGFALKVFATGTHTNSTVPTFNYTIIQS